MRPQCVQAHRRVVIAADERRAGYELALKTARRKRDSTVCVETTLDIDAGARAMAALLNRHPDVRAVFCSADAIAVGALYECQRRDLEIPGRIAIAGFDDTPIAAQVVPIAYDIAGSALLHRSARGRDDPREAGWRKGEASHRRHGVRAREAHERMIVRRRSQ